MYCQKFVASGSEATESLDDMYNAGHVIKSEPLAAVYFS